MAVKSILARSQSADHVRKRVAARLMTLAKKPKGPGREELERLYICDAMDCVQIGKLFGRDPKTVWSWLRFYGVETRSRGSNHAQLPKDGRAWRGRKHTEQTKEAIRQARVLDGRVPYLMPDGSHAMKGRKGSAHPGWKGGITPERQAFYSSKEWKAACTAIWHRADAKCERCGADHREQQNRGTFHVHHIVSFAVRSLRVEPSNLALLCACCHRFVHSRLNISKEFVGVSNGS